MNSDASPAGIEILPLHSRPDLRRLCAVWNFEQWGRDAGRSLDETEMALASMDGSEHALVALLDGRPAGMGLLIDCDLDSHAHLTPWVAGIYVQPDARGRGVATALVGAAEAYARRDGHAMVFLYTEIPDLYARIGWQPHKILHGDDEGMVLMVRRL